jgi:hypothetical protein
MFSTKFLTIATIASVLILGRVATSQAQMPTRENAQAKMPKMAAPVTVEKGLGDLEKVAPEEPEEATVMSDSEDVDADAPQQRAVAVKKALTWKVAKTQVVGGKTYVLMSHDYGVASNPSSHKSDPYVGDTAINQRRSLLCLKKSEKPTPDPMKLMPLNVRTRGGALSYSWSSAKMIAIPNVLGSDLTSRAVADKKCNMMGQLVYGVSGYRMAEFHDGKANSSAGWSFWVEGYSALQGLDVKGLYWIAINDQPANPW